MQKEAIENVRKIDLDDEIVVLDPNKLSFNDATLSTFMEELSIYYDYFSSKTTKAEELLANTELEIEQKHAEHFLKAKTDGLSDKTAEAYAKVQDEMKELCKRENRFKVAAKQLKEYVKALDKAHSMAQNRGYMLRKEMDKLNSDIYSSNRSASNNASEEIDKIIASFGSN